MGKSPLDDVFIASPCNVGWENMQGDERVRFCHECKLSVYNVSQFTRTEAEKLIGKAEEGRVCLRLYRRADGTLITADCPVGLRKIRAFSLKVIQSISAAFASIVATIPVMAQETNPEDAKRLGTQGSYEDYAKEYTRQKALPDRLYHVSNGDQKYFQVDPNSFVGGIRNRGNRETTSPSTGTSNTVKANFNVCDLFDQGQQDEKDGYPATALVYYQKAKETMKETKHDPLFIKKVDDSIIRLQTEVQRKKTAPQGTQ